MFCFKVFRLVKRRDQMTNMLTDRATEMTPAPTTDVTSVNTTRTTKLSLTRVSTNSFKNCVRPKNRHNSSMLSKNNKYNEKTNMLKVLSQSTLIFILTNLHVDPFQIVPMLVIVVLIFIACWTPLLVFNVLQSFDIIPPQLFGILKHLKTTFSLTAYFNR